MSKSAVSVSEPHAFEEFNCSKAPRPKIRKSPIAQVRGVYRRWFAGPGAHAVGGSSAFFPALEGNLGSFRQTCWRARLVRGWGRDLGSFRQTCNRARAVWGESPNWVRFFSESARQKTKDCRNLDSFLQMPCQSPGTACGAPLPGQVSPRVCAV